ncbi:Guanine/hypoxanthine permease pbuG [Sebaldella termitidis]|jgi:AGZA family xanthine/uracil permease-like MFS transporter|uniref:Xanthine/uracil/vitamin C permease n=1 Tax=Sebaldella termitidis (strain ATCC 33386 / NCTC 11300) TaxID=526218 RepID=D1AMJ9_SEBTE|nr:NCS2 family permease [Sebaldella termitidis]ACZ09573.1 Xanthine/uracil/vitamin C permease [Sebaldella termitidis ATCC 33386]SUI24903.1 Guanine/hypoxanthine permease pbuG [Sebaldella termitidis]
MISKFFGFEARETNLKQEIIGGLTTFLTMAYIVIVNPAILSDGTGMDKGALITVTCLAAAIGCLLAAFIANMPIAMAPGMGMNAFFTYSLVVGRGIPWEQALGIVFLSGVIFLALTLMKIREKVVDSIPIVIRYSIAAGIGLFIAFIGLQNMGLIVANPATLIGIGKFTPAVTLGVVGLIITGFFELKKIKGGILYGILITTAIGIITGNASLPSTIVSLPPSIESTFLKFDVIGALKISFIGPIFSFMFLDLFDSIGTIIACAKAAGLEDEDGNVADIGKALEADAIATVAGAILGTSTTTTFVESAAGVADGARTGFSSIVVAICMILTLFFAPIIGIVPGYATAPALIIVGVYMFKNLLNIDFNKMETAIPAFLTIIMMPLAYSISIGISFGFISYVVIEIFQGKIKTINPIMWIITILAIVNLAM